jgi:hypothetical protein
MVEDLIALQKLLDECRDRWLWELEQSENSRQEGDIQHFLRAKAGYRNAQEALDKVEIMLGNASGWPGMFIPEDPNGGAQ